MRKEKSFKIGDKKFTAYELTVKQIAQITDSLDKETEVGDIDLLFPDRLPSSALAMSLDMKIEDLAEYTPSEIEIMIDAAEEINPTFASLIQRLANLGRAALAANKSEEQSAG
jgi:hypothetical protein